MPSADQRGNVGAHHAVLLPAQPVAARRFRKCRVTRGAPFRNMVRGQIAPAQQTAPRQRPVGRSIERLATTTICLRRSGSSRATLELESRDARWHDVTGLWEGTAACRPDAASGSTGSVSPELLPASWRICPGRGHRRAGGCGAAASVRVPVTLYSLPVPVRWRGSGCRSSGSGRCGKDRSHSSVHPRQSMRASSSTPRPRSRMLRRPRCARVGA